MSPRVIKIFFGSLLILLAIVAASASTLFGAGMLAMYGANYENPNQSPDITVGILLLLMAITATFGSFLLFSIPGLFLLSKTYSDFIKRKKGAILPLFIAAILAPLLFYYLAILIM